MNSFTKRQIAPHHIPAEVGEPVGGGIDAGHELEMLGVGDALVDEEENEAGRDEAEREDDGDRDQHVARTRQPAHMQRVLYDLRRDFVVV